MIAFPSVFAKGIVPFPLATLAGGYAHCPALCGISRTDRLSGSEGTMDTLNQAAPAVKVQFSLGAKLVSIISVLMIVSLGV